MEEKRKSKKESDELCDGDTADDKGLDNEVSPSDPVVDDYGFARNWVQVSQQNTASQHAEAEARSVAQLKRESEELCDGDKADDKEVEDEWDPSDDIVDDNGFTRNWVQLDSQINMGHHHHHKKHNRPSHKRNMQTKYTVTKYSDELANGDSADNKELHEEEDMADDVVDFNG